jgi:small ligand-binding sensory domain FIST
MIPAMPSDPASSLDWATPASPPLRFASGVGDAADTAAAVDQALASITPRLAAPVDLVFVFVTPHHLEGLGVLHERLQAVLNPRIVLGVTAEGVIGIRREIEGSPGISILAASLPGAVLPETALHSFAFEPLDWPHVLDDPEAIRTAILGDHVVDPKALILMADPFSTPMVKLLPALSAALPGLPLTGGMASGTRTAGGNRLMHQGRILREGAVGLVIGGPVHAQTTVSQGCRPIGAPLVVTKTHPQKKHVVMELGGQNALAVIRNTIERLDEEDQHLAQTTGLLVGRVINEYKRYFGRGDFLIRGIIGVDQDSGAIAIGDPELRMGQTIQLHLRDQRTAVEDFALLLEAQKLHGSGAGGLLFTCNGRGTRLFDHPHADAGLIHEALGDLPLAGFFAAGELGPVANQNFIHGHTASLLVLRPQA